jgi:hypothetical protein
MLFSERRSIRRSLATDYAWQTPATQFGVLPEQLLPHVPQLVVSFCRSTQKPPQQDRPAVHVPCPAPVQVCEQQLVEAPEQQTPVQPAEPQIHGHVPEASWTVHTLPEVVEAR